VILAPNPGRVHAVVNIDLPAARTAALRSAPEFERLVACAAHKLRETLTQ
jgi:hypothetical protein